MADEGKMKESADDERPGRSAIDVCVAFERAWQAGEPRPAEAMVSDVPVEDQRALLFGLLKREISHRKLRGEDVPVQEYRRRFPVEHELIAALFPLGETLGPLLQQCGYDLVEKIEVGRTGDVYRVLHRAEQRLYAVKIVPALLVRPGILDTQQVVDLDHLIHRHIARPTELVEVEGNLLLFNEYVEGMNFGQLVEEFGKMPVGIACELTCQVAAGLQQLHAHGKAHGALTPTTSVVAIHGEERGIVKLGSVGLTDVADLSLSRFTQAQLQTEYDWRLFAAPEVADQADLVNPACDLYSLGCTLRFLLSGQRPQGSESSETKERIRVLWKRTALSGAHGKVPRELAAAVDRMMAQDPAGRPSSAQEVVEMLSPLRDAAAYRQLVQEVEAAVARRKRLTGGIHVAGPAASEARAPQHQDASAQTDRPPAPDMTPMVAEPQLPGDQPGERETPVAVPSVATRWSHRRSMLMTAGLAIVVCVLSYWGVKRLFTASPVSVESTLAEFIQEGGERWFDEMPWYSPLVRQELARQSRAGPKNLKPIDVRPWVQAVTVPATVPSDENLRHLQRLVETVLSSLDGPEATVSRRLLELSRKEQLTLSETGLEYARLADMLNLSESATACHLRALLRQAGGDDEQAATDYRLALTQYRSQQSPLLPLCACDFAVFCLESPVVATDAVDVLDQCALPYARTVPLQVQVHCCKAALLNRKFGRSREASESIAGGELIADTADLPDAHPLRCRIAEEKAWIALNGWDLRAAQSFFRQAVSLREQQFEAQEHTRSLWPLLADDRRGLAEAMQLMGDPLQASRSLKNLLSTIDGATSLDTVEVVSPLRASQLKSLRPQLLSQLGDFYLCGADYDYAVAGEFYEEAVNCPDGYPPRWSVAVIRQYKLALARALAGRLEEANQALAAADASWQRHSETPLEPISALLEEPAPASPPRRTMVRYCALAHAVLLSRSAGVDEQSQARNALELLVNASETDPQSASMRVLAAQLLLEDSRCETQRTTRVVQQIATLIQNCSKKLTEDQSGFFRRYARVAHFAGQQARRSIDDENVSQQLNESLAVLEKAHRVFRGPAPAAEPLMSSSSRLHTMAIGVSTYRAHSADHPLNLQSAHSDADELHHAFNCLRREDGHGGMNPYGVYGASTLSRLLTNEQATRGAILQFVEELRRLPAADLRKDLVVISLSGHGVQDLDGSLYFLPHDYEPGSLLSTGLSIDLFQSKLRMLGANVLLIIDTCYSGSARPAQDQLVTRRTDEDITLALRRMTQSETALAVLVAGKAREKAGESRMFGGHGALTAAVLEFFTQRRFDVETKDHARPVSLRANAASRLLTLEDLRRYVIDRVAQFPMIDQKPNMYASGNQIGDYWCGDIPLRFAESDDAGD